MIGMGAERFFFARCRQVEIPGVSWRKRILHFVSSRNQFFSRQVIADVLGRIIGKAFIHPRVKTFVRAQNHLVPTVHEFVNRYPHQTWQRTVSGNQGRHRVFHASIATLDKGILLVGILSKTAVDVSKRPIHHFGQRAPIVLGTLVFEVKEMQG